MQVARGHVASRFLQLLAKTPLPGTQNCALVLRGCCVVLELHGSEVYAAGP